MKLIVSILIGLIFFGDAELNEIRKMYPKVAVSESSIKNFQAKLSEVTMEHNKVLVAYKGASTVMFTKYIKIVQEKKVNFKEGVKWIEFAVKSKPDNIEIRMIRMSIQENTPKVAKYNTHIQEDKKFIEQHYQELSGSLKEYIRNFILNSKSFSDTEKANYK
jgi:disulfide oxidoreductase YuzD